jgi:hypothetical protein
MKWKHDYTYLVGVTGISRHCTIFHNFHKQWNSLLWLSNSWNEPFLCTFQITFKKSLLHQDAWYYNESSIISGTGAAIWSKTNFGPTGHHHLGSSPLPHGYTPFSALVSFFKCILEVVFCECVQHNMRFCLDHLNCVKMAAFQILSSIEEAEKSRVGGGRQSCYLW